jgi:phospholipase C
MTNILDDVQTIILLMFENRSFDHMLGHISIDDPSSKIDGLKKPLSNYSNVYKGKPHIPFQIDHDYKFKDDLPHEYDYVSTQLAKSPDTNEYQMSGFVEAYAKFTNQDPQVESDPMSFFNSDQVPITDFLAKNFCICDRWHASLPTGTMPNRSMAFCGDSTIYQTEKKLITIKESLFKWLSEKGISWRVYHDGLSAFVLYNRLWKYVLGKHLCSYASNRLQPS